MPAEVPAKVAPVLISSECVETSVLVPFGWIRQDKLNLVDVLDHCDDYSFLFEHFVRC